MILQKWFESQSYIFKRNIAPPWKDLETSLWEGTVELSEAGFLDFMFGLSATGVLHLTPTHVIFDSSVLDVEIPLREIVQIKQKYRATILTTARGGIRGLSNKFMIKTGKDKDCYSLYRQVVIMCTGAWMCSDYLPEVAPYKPVQNDTLDHDYSLIRVDF